jgi:Ca-activated chloride channel family protein
MDINLNALHFIRPLWLWLLLPALWLPWLWRRQRQAGHSLSSNIAAHLLKHLLIYPQERAQPRPVYLLSALLLLGTLAAAGPTWQEDRPPFVQDQAVLMLAVDLSPSMDAQDVPPSRLQAVKHKLQTLIQRRAGARTGLLVYAGSAHLVLPPTDDPELLNSFVQALATDLLDSPGKNALAVTEQAMRLLQAEQLSGERLSAQQTAGTLVLFSDGADTQQLPALRQLLASSTVDLQLLLVAVGQQATGVLTDAKGAARLDSNGKPLLTEFDQDALQQLAKASGAPIASLTLNDDDLDWIQLHAQQHFAAANAANHEVRWKDAGYWLCWLLLPLAWLSIRRGWRVNWLPALLLTIGLTGQAPNAQAGALADAFMSADQQGRWAFEQQRYPAAAEHFNDPYWKGLAAYKAAEFNLALASFAKLDSAAGYFYLGNSHARLHQYPQALSAYAQALRLQPDFAQAQFNQQLVAELQRLFEADQQVAPEDDPDQQQFDDQGKPGDKGKKVMLNGPKKVSAELWLRNLNTSPAGFLKQKFRLQQAASQALPAVSP